MFWVTHQFRWAKSALVVRVRPKMEIQYVEGTYRLKRTCIVKKNHSTLIAIHLPVEMTAPLSKRYCTIPTCFCLTAISRGGFCGWNRNRFNYRKAITMDTCTTESSRNWLPFEQVESDFTKMLSVMQSGTCPPQTLDQDFVVSPSSPLSTYMIEDVASYLAQIIQKP